MFIAVIQENFDVSEDEKRLQQVKMFLQRKDIGSATHGYDYISKRHARRIANIFCV
jgi:hypothetical protein